MELKHESITLSSLVRRALNPTCSILICFSREGGGVLAPGFLRSLYRRVQGILRSLLIRWTNLSNVLNRKVGHYVVFLNRRNNSVSLHQVVDGDQLTTEINGLTYSTNYTVEVVGIDTIGKPYKTPQEATMTANRKRRNVTVFFFFFFSW